MSEFVTRAEFEAVVAELDALKEVVNSLRHKPPLDVTRLDRVMRDRYQVKPTLVRR